MYQIPRNSLALILVAQALVILPHVVRLPVWITLICIGCGIWRVMVFQGRWSFPGRLVKTLFVFGSFVGIGVGYGTLLGLEPWVGILTTAFVLKLLEMQQQRDVYTVITLAYFVALTEFLFEQTIPYAIYISFCVVMITASLVALNQSESSIEPVRAMKKSGVMLLQALPLMLVLFVLFPRIAPLWSVPLQSDVGRTGVSDQLAPGTIADLVQSDELAFNATFEGEIPDSRDLYWRGLVLSYFDEEAQAWTHPPDTAYYRFPWNKRQQRGPFWADQAEYRGRRVNYSIIMEPSNQQWLFTLDLPVVNDNTSIQLLRDFRYFSFTPVSTKFRYEVESFLDYRIDRDLHERWRAFYLELPDTTNLRTQALARNLRLEVGSDLDYVNRVMNFFGTGGFVYTLKPPLLNGDTIDQFLMESREGFCEHYASSFVYLMRAGGVPARIVVGYLGGEYNRRGDYVAVHQFDAHAWTEVWLEGEGWVRVDPTSIIAPERITDGLETAVQGEAFLENIGLSLMKFNSNYWIAELRLQISAMNHYWDAWVVGYTPDVQMNLLNQYFEDIDRKTLGILLLSSFFGVLAVVGLFLSLKQSRRKLQPIEQEYLKFCAALARQDLPRQTGEGALAFADRVSVARPDLATWVRNVTDAYVQANFVEDTPDDAAALKKIRGQFTYFSMRNK